MDQGLCILTDAFFPAEYERLAMLLEPAATQCAQGVERGGQTGNVIAMRSGV